jgi:hypothetical protein
MYQSLIRQMGRAILVHMPLKPGCAVTSKYGLAYSLAIGCCVISVGMIASNSGLQESQAFAMWSKISGVRTTGHLSYGNVAP